MTVLAIATGVVVYLATASALGRWMQRKRREQTK